MTLPIEITERRRAALKKLMDKCGVGPDDYEAETEEDVAPFFTEKRPPQFCLETDTDAQHYFLLHETLPQAQSRGEEYVLDNICAERPVRITDLDTGATWIAQRAKVEYEKVS